MPMLDWIGKDKVINHHLDVPYRVLERQYIVIIILVISELWSYRFIVDLWQIYPAIFK